MDKCRSDKKWQHAGQNIRTVYRVYKACCRIHIRAASPDPENSVFAESEEDMKKDIVDTIIEEDFGRMIDLLLNTEDVRKAYQRGDGHTWIGCIGDGFLQEGLRHLDGQMLSIIETLVFEDMTIYEVSQHLGIDTDSVYEKIQESRRILLRYI